METARIATAEPQAMHVDPTYETASRKTRLVFLPRIATLVVAKVSGSVREFKAAMTISMTLTKRQPMASLLNELDDFRAEGGRRTPGRRSTRRFHGVAPSSKLNTQTD